MKFLMTALFTAVLMIAQPVLAQNGPYHFDKAHTSIVFYVNHLGFSNSVGRFLDFDGHFIFDQANPENSSVEVIIPTASIEMHDEAWNAHLKNEDFFNVEQYPEMTFKSTAIEVTGENTANLTGDLTLLGVTKPVTLAVTHNKSGERKGDYVSGFSARGMLNRSEWGMNYGIPMVSDEVEILIEVEATRQDEMSADDTSTAGETGHENHAH